MHDLLLVAEKNGSVFDAVTTAGAIPLEDAEANGWLTVHSRSRNTTVRAANAAWDAAETSQINDLYLRLTDAGRTHLGTLR